MISCLSEISTNARTISLAARKVAGQKRKSTKAPRKPRKAKRDDDDDDNDDEEEEEDNSAEKAPGRRSTRSKASRGVSYEEPADESDEEEEESQEEEEEIETGDEDEDRQEVEEAEEKLEAMPKPKYQHSSSSERASNGTKPPTISRTIQPLSSDSQDTNENQSPIAPPFSSPNGKRKAGGDSETPAAFMDSPVFTRKRNRI